MNPLYPSDLSDAEWDRLQRLLPPRSPHARLRRHSLRSVFDALFYLLRTGCPWRYLPANFPPWQTVYYHFRQFSRTGLWTHLWRELRTAERRRVGKDAHPSAAIMDSQSVKTVEESARIWGFDAHKHVKGRKRHVLVDTLGLPLCVRGFAVVPKRWIVERTFGWLSRYRRMSKDYERKVPTSETLIAMAMIRLVLARLRRQAERQAKPTVRKKPVYTP